MTQATSFTQTVNQIQGFIGEELELEFKAEKIGDSPKRTYTVYRPDNLNNREMLLSFSLTEEQWDIYTDLFLKDVVNGQHSQAIFQLAAGDRNLLAKNKSVLYLPGTNGSVANSAESLKNVDTTSHLKYYPAVLTFDHIEDAAKLIFTQEYIAKIQEAIKNVDTVTTTITEKKNEIKVEAKKLTPLEQESISKPRETPNTDNQQQTDQNQENSNAIPKEGCCCVNLFCGWIRSLCSTVTGFFTSLYNCFCSKKEESV